MGLGENRVGNDTRLKQVHKFSRRVRSHQGWAVARRDPDRGNGSQEGHGTQTLNEFWNKLEQAQNEPKMKKT